MKYKKFMEQQEARKALVHIGGLIKRCESKKERAALMREYSAAAKVLGIDVAAERRKFCREQRSRRKLAALTLTKEKRQEVLDAIHNGGTVDDICEACGVSQDDVVGVYELNQKTHTYRTLNRETV